MEYRTFGEQNSETIMLLHGNMMSWRQFSDVIPLPGNNCRASPSVSGGLDDSGTT